MPKQDGGHAFPLAVGNLALQNGMTLRDWFAGQALAGLTAEYRANTCYEESGALHHIATHAYALADAMLAERET